MSAFLAPASIAGQPYSQFSEEKVEEEGFYLTVGAGSGQWADISIDGASGGGDIEFDAGFVGDLGVGYDFGNIRAELVFNHLQNEVASIQGLSSNAELEINTVFLTAYYDFRANKKWQPYLGLGIGSSEIEVNETLSGTNVTYSATTDDVVSAVLKAGITYNASEKVDVYGELWSQGYDDFTLGSGTFSNCGALGGSLGARFKF